MRLRHFPSSLGGGGGPLSAYAYARRAYRRIGIRERQWKRKRGKEEKREGATIAVSGEKKKKKEDGKSLPPSFLTSPCSVSREKNTAYTYEIALRTTYRFSPLKP